MSSKSSSSSSDSGADAPPSETTPPPSETTPPPSESTTPPPSAETASNGGNGVCFVHYAQSNGGAMEPAFAVVAGFSVCEEHAAGLTDLVAGLPGVTPQ